MLNEITQYIDEVNRAYQTGNATEHTYRPALQRLLENIVSKQNLSQLKNLRFTNEPKRIDCGAPDYIVTRKDIPVGYIEAKDIGVDLSGGAVKKQFDRYKRSLDNIIFTDYLEFRHYINGELVKDIRIAEVKGGKIVPIKAHFEHFELLIKDFGGAHPQSIASSADIAKMMAGKARLLAEVIENSFENGNNDGANTLTEQLEAFKTVLIHDIKPKEFADVYAQTIAYGLFAARLHDETPDTFCRRKAADLIPKTNPFLRNLFDTIVGINLDDRIRWIVDDLADAFRVANMAEFEKDFGEHTLQNDPIIHFYEDFLSRYDPKLRKSRGVWYTPQAVVSFIVRAVDDILQNEFDLQMGLADTSKTTITVNNRKTDIHKVQLLDPATGTGTFLAETVNRIYDKFKGQAGKWQSYVEKHLIPRINGFEILMASYTMAHIKLELLLSQTGYNAIDNQRLRIYLTNSLEEHHPATNTFFAQFLAREANEANEIKRDTPIMVVMGNPPYNVSTQNKGQWIQNLITDYKKDLNERKINLDDDYIKFIRFGQHYIEKNGEGVLAYISNNSFIDGITHRRMRKTLLEAFDKIYILNLHGSAKQKEVCPDGSKDENVFDIQQGVCINIFVKTGRKAKNSLAKVYHAELFGKREEKYEFLLKNNRRTVKWQLIKPDNEYYFFVPKNFGYADEYERGFRIEDLFPVYNSGVQTDRDSLFIDDDRKTLADRIKILLSGKFNDEFRQRFRVEDSSSYKLTEAMNGTSFDDSFIQRIEYRPFDKKWIYYSPELISRPASKVMTHLLNGENVGLIFKRGFTEDAPPAFISDCITERRTWACPGMQGSDYVCPLYLYPTPNNILSSETRKPNLNETVINEISQRIGLQFVYEKEKNQKKFAPIDILDYIYAVLHSPTYREKYREFLKIDFPRVPYPKSAQQFRTLVKYGEKLRRLHLLDGVEPKKGTADYPIAGNDEVETVRYEPGKTGKVWINAKQYFNNVSKEAWNFYIGGYQVAQKWLKDRKGRKLEFEDIQHYQKIISVLAETSKIMTEIEI